MLKTLNHTVQVPIFALSAATIHCFYKLILIKCGTTKHYNMVNINVDIMSQTTYYLLHRIITYYLNISILGFESTKNCFKTIWHSVKLKLPRDTVEFSILNTHVQRQQNTDGCCSKNSYTVRVGWGGGDGGRGERGPARRPGQPQSCSERPV